MIRLIDRVALIPVAPPTPTPPYSCDMKLREREGVGLEDEHVEGAVRGGCCYRSELLREPSE